MKQSHLSVIYYKIFLNLSYTVIFIYFYSFSAFIYSRCYCLLLFKNTPEIMNQVRQLVRLLGLVISLTQGLSLPTQDSSTQRNVDKHSCFRWNSNPCFLCSSSQNPQLRPWRLAYICLNHAYILLTLWNIHSFCKVICSDYFAYGVFHCNTVISPGRGWCTTVDIWFSPTSCGIWSISTRSSNIVAPVDSPNMHKIIR
jgi:hypothetical protein